MIGIIQSKIVLHAWRKNLVSQVRDDQWRAYLSSMNMAYLMCYFYNLVRTFSNCLVANSIPVKVNDPECGQLPKMYFRRDTRSKKAVRRNTWSWASGSSRLGNWAKLLGHVVAPILWTKFISVYTLTCKNRQRTSSSIRRSVSKLISWSDRCFETSLVKLRSVRLRQNQQFDVPKNYKLVAAPLFEIFDNRKFSKDFYRSFIPWGTFYHSFIPEGTIKILKF